MLVNCRIACKNAGSINQTCLLSTQVFLRRNEELASKNIYFPKVGVASCGAPAENFEEAVVSKTTVEATATPFHSFMIRRLVFGDLMTVELSRK